MLIVATENDTVAAIDARSGKIVWTRSSGPAGAALGAALRQYRPAGDHRHAGHRPGDAGGLSRCDGRRGFGAAPQDLRRVAEGRRRPARLAGRRRRRVGGAGPAFQRPRSEPARRARHPRRPGLCPLWRAFRRLRQLSRLGRRRRPDQPRPHRRLEHPRAGRRHLGAGRDRQRRAFVVCRHRQHHGRAALERRRGGVSPGARPRPQHPTPGLFRALRLARARRQRRRSRRHQSIAARRAGRKRRAGADPGARQGCARLPARPRQSRRHRRQPLKRDGRHRPDPHRGVGLSRRRRRLCRVRGRRARTARHPAAATR